MEPVSLRKRVAQTDTGHNSGNCWSACIASLLGLPIELVPNFCGDAKAKAADGESRPDWMTPAQEWLRQRGLGFVTLGVDGSGAFPILPNCTCIINGKSPRGNHLHAVVGNIVCKDGAIEFDYQHDPHPSGAFLDGSPTSIDFFVPVRNMADPK